MTFFELLNMSNEELYLELFKVGKVLEKDKEELLMLLQNKEHRMQLNLALYKMMIGD